MENTSERDEAADTLKAAERAGAAPLIDYPPTPRWYPYAGGAWFAAIVAVATFRPASSVAVPAIVALIALLAGFLGWYSRKRGTWPTLSDAPPEFRSVFRLYAVGVVVIAAIVAGLAIWAPPAAAPIATLVLVTVGLAAYERVYARAADATRERLR